MYFGGLFGQNIGIFNQNIALFGHNIGIFGHNIGILGHNILCVLYFDRLPQRLSRFGSQLKSELGFLALQIRTQN